MAQYAFAFDLDKAGMDEEGLSKSQITIVYKNLRNALKAAGFGDKTQESIYRTQAGKEGMLSLMNLESTLKTLAPDSCKWLKRVHVFRMEEWSNVTPIFTRKGKFTPKPPKSLEESVFPDL